MTEGIQDKTYRTVDSDSPRARSAKGCSPPGNSWGDEQGIRLTLLGELSTPASTIGRAILIAMKVGPSCSRMVTVSPVKRTFFHVTWGSCCMRGNFIVALRCQWLDQSTGWLFRARKVAPSTTGC